LKKKRHFLSFQALDMLLDKMMSDGFDFSKVAGISGDGQV
jgi:hypothetical protein